MWCNLHSSKLNKVILILINILILSFNANASSFKLTSSTKYNNQIPVRKYVSEKTGLTVVLADVEGPHVSGHFLLATEAMDDDGLPHTLEHLVFLGSELYPYKGVLDLLANRCLASGTNAWTATDHTCYTLTTAGSEGFLSLLPIYIDHILYPTLTDASFITEIHHVSGKGEDGGVVYSEMQGRENNAHSRTHLQMIRAMFPNSSYSAETGGMLDNMRTSTTIEKIRDYHSVYYRPENLFIIITGKVSHEDVFEALESVEDRIIKKGKLPPFERPFRTPIDPLTSSKEFKIVYPSDEEDRGQVMITWRGPKPKPSEMLSIKACSIILSYLGDTSVSPLQKELIEVEDPYASSIGNYIDEMMESVLYFSFRNVPLEKIDQIYDKLMEVLNKIISGDERIDMERLTNIINREIMQELSRLENNPHGVSSVIIEDCLYGNSDEEFKYRLDPIKQLEEIRTFNESFWVGLIEQYLIDGHHVLVKSVPSIQEQKKIAQDEINRIDKQRKDLGTTGLLLKEKELMDAMAINDISPPIEMLTEVNVPGTEGIKFHSIKVYRSNENENPPGLDFDLLPVYAEAYDTHTSFVYLIATINTASLPRDFRLYLPLLFELLTESPIRQGNFLIPYEEVVAALQKDTISYRAELGIRGSFSQTATMAFQIEPKKYVKGVNWMIDLLHNTEFQIDRIKVTAAKMANSVAQEKRDGTGVASSILSSLFYNADSNIVQGSMLKQHKFLTSLLKRLENPLASQIVVDNLNAIRSNITDPSNLSVHIAADWKKLSKMNINLNKPWSKIAPICRMKEELKINPDWKIIKPEGNFPNRSGSIVGIGSEDSASLFQASTTINDFMDPDLPALMLFLQYLTQTEGPLWKQIRGQGLAYGFHMDVSPSQGLLIFVLYRATNVVAAYKKAREITEAQLTENAVWDQTLVESAKSSLIFTIIAGESSVGNLVIQSFLSSFMEVPLDYNRILINRVNNVTEEDLIRVGKLYVANMFSNKAKISIVCHTDKVNEIANEFKQWGNNFFIRKMLSKKKI